jgi:peptidoglycan hydrolase CwlO-like protein
MFFISLMMFVYTSSPSGASSSSLAAINVHAGVRLVLSGTDTTDTKAVELKSLEANIANQLERRREELALLQSEAKSLNERMQSLASLLTPNPLGSCVSM